MKRWLFLIVILCGSGGALYYSQRQKQQVPVGPQAVLNALADTQREISRLPAGIVRLSEEEEVSAGDAMAQRFLGGRPSLGANDAELEKYVATVGRTVSSHARRKLDYRFHYIPDAN